MSPFTATTVVVTLIAITSPANADGVVIEAHVDRPTERWFNFRHVVT